MKNSLEKFWNILNCKKNQMSEKCKEYISETKKYITAALIWANILIINPVNAENKDEVTSEFNYIAPKIDENWFLKARTDLKDESEISDGYNSIYELFTKLNSMTKTQVEPIYKPQYFWEINKKTWEKIPTFIIVWDVHADEYNIWEEVEDFFQKSMFLAEKNEDANQEIEVVELLNKKFWLNVVWLENEFFEEENNSKIWKWIDNLGIKTIWLEDKEIMNEANLFIAKEALLSFEYFKLLWIDLDIEVTEEDYNNIINDKEVLEIINSGMSMEKIILDETINYDKKIELTKEYSIKSYEEVKDNKDLLIKFYKYHKYIFKNSFWEESLKNIVNKVKNINISKDIYDNIEKSAKNTIDSDLVTIEKRNEKWIEIISDKLDEEKIAVMVYWKAHIPNLIKQLNKKYDWKVNIYVAK